MITEEKKRFNTREAASYLGVSVSFLNQDRCEGPTIPFIKLGGRVVYDIADLDAALARGRRQGAAHKADCSCLVCEYASL
jgi:hypothetical protein